VAVRSSLSGYEHSLTCAMSFKLTVVPPDGTGFEELATVADNLTDLKDQLSEIWSNEHKFNFYTEQNVRILKLEALDRTEQNVKIFARFSSPAVLKSSVRTPLACYICVVLM
jgi:hypothetical protein